MRPAFSSTKQAAAFALLLLVLLALPVVMGKNLLPPREQSYAIQGWDNGPYPWLRQQIFEETNDIDIAFVGSSHMFNGINTPYVQEQLSAQLGRPAVVRSITWDGAGYDVLYLITQDLLAHRHVKFLVFYDENNGRRNYQIPILFRFGDNAAMLEGLPFPEQSLFYCAAIIGMPRNLLSLIRPNLPVPLVTDKINFWTIIANAPNPATQLGCLSVRQGFAPSGPTITHAPFETFVPNTSIRPTDVLAYAPATKTNFEFSTMPIPTWQTKSALRFEALLHEHGVHSVMIYIPVLAQARKPVIWESAFWPGILGGGILIGIPPTKMFGSISDVDLLKLYADPMHFNQNGQEYFTHLITPTLLKLYENSTNH